MRLSGCRASWDFFTQPEGKKQGIIREISEDSALLCCSKPIESTRWLRVALHPHAGSQQSLARVVYARVRDQYEMLDLWEDESMTLYRHELEWIEPLEPEWVALLSPPIWKTCDCSNFIKKQSAQDLCGLCALRVSIHGPGHGAGQGA